MKKGDLFPLSNSYNVRMRPQQHQVRFTGEVRFPMRGEYFISGAIPEGYLSPGNLSVAYPIAKLVEVRVEVREIVTEIEEEG